MDLDAPEASGEGGYDMLSGSKGRSFAVNHGPMPKKKTKELPSMQRSQLGRMVDSQKRTGAAFGFGTAQRFPGEGKAQLKQYISKEHMNQAFGSTVTPGPGTYSVEGAFGDQKVSERRTFGMVHFQRNGRFAQDDREGRQKQRIPAPWTYKADISSNGVQTSSLRETAPVVRIGCESRDVQVSIRKGFEGALYGNLSPGPIYHPCESMGKQAHSGRSKGPAFGFGTEPCFTDPKIMSPIEKRASRIPGPGAYQVESSCAPQTSSLRRSQPFYGMGTTTRDQAGVSSLEAHRAPTVLGGKFSPGTAMYQENTTSLNPPKINSTKRNNPTVVFGTDDKFLKNRSTSHLAPGPGSYCV